MAVVRSVFSRCGSGGFLCSSGLLAGDLSRRHDRAHLAQGHPPVSAVASDLVILAECLRRSRVVRLEVGSSSRWNRTSSVCADRHCCRGRVGRRASQCNAPNWFRDRPSLDRCAKASGLSNRRLKCAMLLRVIAIRNVVGVDLDAPRAFHALRRALQIPGFHKPLQRSFTLRGHETYARQSRRGFRLLRGNPDLRYCGPVPCNRFRRLHRHSARV